MKCVLFRKKWKKSCSTVAPLCGCYFFWFVQEDEREEEGGGRGRKGEGEVVAGCS